MEEKLIELASSQGIWTTLAVALIFYILKYQEKRDKKQEEREIKYQDIISKLTDKIDIIEDIKRDVSDLKDYLLKNNI